MMLRLKAQNLLMYLLSWWWREKNFLIWEIDGTLKKKDKNESEKKRKVSCSVDFSLSDIRHWCSHLVAHSSWKVSLSVSISLIETSGGRRGEKRCLLSFTLTLSENTEWNKEEKAWLSLWYAIWRQAFQRDSFKDFRRSYFYIDDNDWEIARMGREEMKI